MSEEDFEEWDADFLDQVIQVEELALASSNLTQSRQHQSPPPPPPPHDFVDSSYSPPRELSQRPPRQNDLFDLYSNAIPPTIAPILHPTLPRRSENERQAEIDQLKKELEKVTKQLTYWKKECSELRKERDKKVEQPKSVFCHREAKDAESLSSKKNGDFGPSLQEENANKSNQLVKTWAETAPSTSVSRGIQTENGVDCIHLSTKKYRASNDQSDRLLAVWGCTDIMRLGKNLVSNLLLVCETDFHALFQCFGVNFSSKTLLGSLGKESSADMALHARTSQSAEAEKVSHLYSVLTKISNGMVKLEALVQVLLDLCTLDNSILLRGNVVEMSYPRDGNVEFAVGCKSSESKDDILQSGFTQVGPRSSYGEKSWPKIHHHRFSIMSVSCIDWDFIFEVMCQISRASTEECVKVEVARIMNIIVANSNAFLERARFGKRLVFECISQLLRREGGVGIQNHAVHLLYLLLNSPKLFQAFCSGCNENPRSAATEVRKDASETEDFRNIMVGLADCLTCHGDGKKEVSLRRHIISLLAFIASYGKAGSEIFLNLELSKGNSFLELIIRVLVMEIDAEATELAEDPETFKERLVSNQAYSANVFRILLSSRDITSLTIDVANRLSRDFKLLRQLDSVTGQMRQFEIIELAR
ncbi:hypothetical protein RJ641_000823, partial [Dillenia turbinata]